METVLWHKAPEHSADSAHDNSDSSIPCAQGHKMTIAHVKETYSMRRESVQVYISHNAEFVE